MTMNNTQLVDIADIQLQPIQIENDSAAVSEKTVKSQELWANGPVLIQLVRRPGCINCREIAHDLQEHRDLLNALGIRTVAIVKENIPEDVVGFHEYARCDMFVDAEMRFFRSLTGGKIVRHNPLMTLLRPLIWRGIKRASSKGVKNGSLGGESSINGGFYLVSKDGVHYQNNEELGYLPPFSELLDACRKVSNNTEAVDQAGKLISGGVSDVKRMVCTADVCVRT